jgi:exonuclease V gamma subunit
VKTAFKRRMFLDVEDIKKNVTAALNAVRLEAFAELSKPEFSKPATNVFKYMEITLYRNKTIFIFPYQSGNFTARPRDI